jgi:hypothetical protein
MLTGLVHRTFLLVGTARHARFGRGEPALALGKVTADKHKDDGDGHETGQARQHPLRMLNRAA